MKNVLLLTDFTSKSINAHHYACRLLYGQACDFYFLNIQKIWEYTMDDIMVATDSGSLDDALLGDNRTKNKEQIRNFEEFYTHENYTFHGLADYDDFIHSIKQATVKFDIELIVIGTNGKTGIKEVFVGSHAVDVIKNIVPIPLFLVPKSSNFEQLKNIMYATDFKKDADQHNLTVLKKIIRAHYSRLHLAHIYNDSSEQNIIEVTYKHLKKELEDIEYTTYWISSEKKMEEDITKFCKEHEINLLILTYHKYGFLKSLLKTSFVEKASFHLDIPLLILPDPD